MFCLLLVSLGQNFLIKTEIMCRNINLQGLYSKSGGSYSYLCSTEHWETSNYLLAMLSHAMPNYLDINFLIVTFTHSLVFHTELCSCLFLLNAIPIHDYGKTIV